MSDASQHRIDRDDLLSRVDLVAVLDAVSPSGGHGHRRQWRCPSPTHEDHHPSVKVSTDSSGTQRWRCWSGGEHGTAIDAVMAAKSMNVADALRWLNDNYAHLDVLPRRPAPEPRPVGRPAAEAVEYVLRCEKLLWSGSGRPVLDWLHGRGLGDDVLHANRVGADPGRRFLPRAKGLPAGWPAAVFPALDRGGDISYFQARFLTPPQGRGKYDNPSRKWASNPRVAWTQPVTTIPERGELLIVAEGTPDALIAAQAGFASVAVLGSMYPDARVAEAIATYAAERDVAVVVCFDCDDSQSGAKGAHKLIELLEDRSVRSVANVTPPDGMDLSDWAAADGDWVVTFDELTPSGVGPLMERSMPDPGIDLALGS